MCFDAGGAEPRFGVGEVVGVGRGLDDFLYAGQEVPKGADGLEESGVGAEGPSSDGEEECVPDDVEADADAAAVESERGAAVVVGAYASTFRPVAA